MEDKRPTTHYTWRTMGDSKVRPSHAANDGKVFAWNNPPPTGHPGEAPNCRCTAEPFYGQIPEIDEYIDITMYGTMDDAKRVWKTGPIRPLSAIRPLSDIRLFGDFYNRYLYGKGRPIRLRDTGHLQKVVDQFRKVAIDDPTRLPAQIANKARENNPFQDTFNNSYNMGKIVWDLGWTTIKGNFWGSSSEKNGILTIEGYCEFSLRDAFKDPYDTPNLRQEDFEFLGEPYDIKDEWKGKFSGKVYSNKNESDYK